MTTATLQSAAGSVDVLAVIRAPLEQYPPSVYQIALLAEAGLRVRVVDLMHPDYSEWQFQGAHPVARYHACRHFQYYKERQSNLIARAVRWWEFKRCARRLLRDSRAKVVIAYDPDSIHVVGKLWREPVRPRLVWHFHELWPLGMGNARTQRATRFCYQNAQQADLNIFPDRGRAEMFARAAKLSRPPQVVMNCPRQRETVPEEKLSDLMKRLGYAGFQTIYFHGWIGPSRRVDMVIESMTHWPKRSALMLVGPVESVYRRRLFTLAEQRGMSQRVFFLGQLAQAELWQLSAGATVGVSLVSDATDLNWVYSAGAINKRFEYMAVGLPQIANTGPGMAEIMEQPDCGVLVEANSPEAIGQAIGKLLTDDGARARMRANARSAHLQRFNYEEQFAAVKEQIIGWAKG